MHVLIICPNGTQGRQVQQHLKYENISSDVVLSVERSYVQMLLKSYQGILIYHELPGFDGPMICRKLKEIKRDIIIGVCVDGKDESMERSCSISGVDFLYLKEDSIQRWTNIMKYLVNKIGEEAEEEELIYKDLKLNRINREVRRNRRKFILRNKEYSLLEFFLKNVKVPLKRDTIIEHVWDYNTQVMSNTVDVHISSLRRKIDFCAKYKLIKTIPCYGYIFG